MFSHRLRFELEENDLWRTLLRKRARGDTILDLTESNPTRVGLFFPEKEILDALAPPEALSYEPSPKGHVRARRAVRGYYRGHGRRVAEDDIVLTASTSEAYSFLFKLLCDPGDRVLVPRPSYPLFDHLAALDLVELVPYPVELGAPERLPPRCRAVIAVHPNNPTGTYVSKDAAEHLVELSVRNDIALVIDEVFLDYPFAGASMPESFAGGDRGLVFVLSGLSKLAALPQMKLAWIAVGGESRRREEAIARLEHIADTYLSVGTPAQLAAPRFLELAPAMRAILRRRVQDNLGTLVASVRSAPAVTLPPPEGGWYATLRLPAILSSGAWALEFLERDAVYLHPGDFFGFDHGCHVVVSLLPLPAELREALSRVLRSVSDRVDSSGA